MDIGKYLELDTGNIIFQDLYSIKVVLTEKCIPLNIPIYIKKKKE